MKLAAKLATALSVLALAAPALACHDEKPTTAQPTTTAPAVAKATPKAAKSTKPTEARPEKGANTTAQN